MSKCRSEADAAAIAKERGLYYGFCVFDGFFYVGTQAQLTKIGCEWCHGKGKI
jgi:hypothetical protein